MHVSTLFLAKLNLEEHFGQIKNQIFRESSLKKHP